MNSLINRAKRNQGMNWISQHKRLSIYLRDGLSCMYCGTGVEKGIQLTLDHLIPYSKHGTNSETNLVTCCLTCNSSRGNRTVAAFVRAAAQYRGIDVKCILKTIKNNKRKVLDITTAKQLIKERGSCNKVLQQI